MIRVDNIITQVKQLTEEELIVFNSLFNELYKPIKEKQKNKRKQEKELKEQEYLNKAYLLADKIFTKIQIKAIPVSYCGKAFDAPYNNYEGMFVGSDFFETLIEYEKYNDEELLDYIADMIDEVCTYIPSKYSLSEKNANDLYPGQHYYCFLTNKHEFIYGTDNDYIHIIENGVPKK